MFLYPIGLMALPPILHPNDRWAMVGDSITAGASIPSWIITATTQTQGRLYMPPGYNRGTAGITAASLAGAAQTDAVLRLEPDLVSWLAGTNDLDFTADTPATIYGYIVSGIIAYLNGGAKCAEVCTVLPRYSPNALSSGRETDRQTLNGLIRGMVNDASIIAAGHGGKIRVTDADPLMTNSSYFIDGLHPNWTGATRLGVIRGNSINEFLEQDFRPTDLYLDAATSLLVAGSLNPALSGTSGSKSGTSTPTGNVADTWTVTENGGMTVVCSKDTLNGVTAQRVVVSGACSTTGSLVTFENTVPYSGLFADQLEACVDFSLSAGVASLLVFGLTCDTGITPSATETSHMNGITALSGVLRTPVTTPLAASDSSTPIRAFLSFESSGAVAADIKFSRPYIQKIPESRLVPNNNLAEWDGHGSKITLANSNRDAQAYSNTDPYSYVRGAKGRRTSVGGKHYFEIEVIARSHTDDFMVGLLDNSNVSGYPLNGAPPITTAVSYGAVTRSDGASVLSGTFADGTAAGWTSVVAGDIIGVAVDLTNKKLFFLRNNVASGTSNAVTGANPRYTWTADYLLFPACLLLGNGGAASTVARLRASSGQLNYTPPTGYSAWV